MHVGQIVSIVRFGGRADNEFGIVSSHRFGVCIFFRRENTILQGKAWNPLHIKMF
jgi:hypothetical protein